MNRLFFLIPLLLTLTNCTSEGHYLITSTGTVIGVEVANNATSGTPTASLGYKRAELAIVPTNRRICIVKDSDQSIECEDESGINEGAKDTGEVLLELRYGGIFDLGASSGIYQRLAVGTEAVKQPGAAFMFARSGNSEISNETASEVSEAIAAQANTAELESRSAETLQLARQQRVSLILDKVDQISDAQALAIEANPPVQSDSVDNVVALRDPGNQRTTNATIARQMLKTRIVLDNRSDDSLNAWDASLTAALPTP